MTDDPPVVLTKGSRYRVLSVETRDKPMVTHGTFQGYGTVGPSDAICIILDESHRELAGKTRLIPIHMVLSIDVVDQVDPEKAKTDEPRTMYG